MWSIKKFPGPLRNNGCSPSDVLPNFTLRSLAVVRLLYRPNLQQHNVIPPKYYTYQSSGWGLRMRKQDRLIRRGTPTRKWSHIKSPLETMTDYKGTHPCFNTVLVWGLPKPCFRMDALNVFRTRKASFPSMSAMGDQTVWGWQKLSGCLNRPHLVRTAILRQRMNCGAKDSRRMNKFHPSFIRSFIHIDLGLFAPYLDLPLFRPGVPSKSLTPRIRWNFAPGRSFTLPPLINTIGCSCGL